MKNKAVVASIAFVLVLFAWTTQPLADEKPGDEPKDYRFAILSVDDVSFVLPSVIVLGGKARQKPLELVVTNHTKKEHGFAIDKMKVREVLKPGETKTITVPVADLASLAKTGGKAIELMIPFKQAA